MGIRIHLNDYLTDATIRNYVERAILQEVEYDYKNFGEEYEIIYPTYQDLPDELKSWIRDNKIKVLFYYNERIPNWLEFENENDVLLFKMRWG